MDTYNGKWLHRTNRTRWTKAFNRQHRVFLLIENMSERKFFGMVDGHRPTRCSVFFFKQCIVSNWFHSIWFDLCFSLAFSRLNFVTFKRSNGPSFDFIICFNSKQLIGLIGEMRENDNNGFLLLTFLFSVPFFGRMKHMKILSVVQTFLLAFLCTRERETRGENQRQKKSALVGMVLSNAMCDCKQFRMEHLIERYTNRIRFEPLWA